MSIKDLFNSTGTPKIQKSVTSDELVQNVESSDYVEAKRKQFDEFVPPIDFASASNFAKFGSAELYYEKAFERIYQYYPYDGTLHEKVEFENSSSYLDKYVFENLYPRTNGYVTFDGSTQYISVFGGPHTASSGMAGKTLDSTFDYSIKYDEEKKRTSAFEYRNDDGITIEFWLKVPNTSSTRTIFHVSGTDGGQIKLELHNSDYFYLTMNSSASLLMTQNILPSASNGTDWNHFAITIQSGSSGTKIQSYKNGSFVQTTNAPAGIESILPGTDGLNLRIGAPQDPGNKLIGSMDEFRYWKKARTHEEIFNTWFIPIGGGTNKHDANVDLGCYFKFNEGITGNSALDGMVLDYSGRINNGTVTGYASSFRNTGSAITEKLGEPEWQDPIIYSSHPDVISKKAEYMTSGSLADLENSSMLFHYFPGWMQEEDEQSGKQLKYLSQVMASYFDTLWHQISFVNKVHDHHYISGSNKPLPFAKKLLYDRGFVMPDLFVDATITENLLKKDDNEVFEKEINEVRNTIYHNLYNNLDGIYKSKGTEKSFRNFFRSLGIGQDVVKLRMYADDSTFVLRNNYENKSYERKFLNFNKSTHFDATIYQTSSANNANLHIPGDTNYSGSYTLETEIVLPRKQKKNEPNYSPFTALTASIMGFHTSGSGYTHPSPDYPLSVYVVRSTLQSSLAPDDQERVKFVITGSGFNLESDEFSYQYENNKWNLAVRVFHENYPYGNVTGNVANNYKLEFYGVEADGNTKRQSFELTHSFSNNSYFTTDKIFYAGAHKENFTGTSVHNTDIKLGYVRYWHSYLTNDAIDQHAFDSETFGANEPFENDLVNTYPVEIPREKTLAFHWAFNDQTGSNSSGEMTISDLSSGSTDSNYGLLSDTIQRYVAAKAEGFDANASDSLDKMYLNIYRKRLPDDLMSSDLTTIKSEETENFFVDDDVSDNFYSFEKSMYGTISDEMMNMFSTALDLNNLIGQPNQKYHHRYNMLDFLKERFYEDVENEPDLEKFTSFYKWIDDSISIALQQLVPASARFSEKINNIIESHVLERSKYVHQIPMTTTFESTEGSIKGISEMKYNWKFGHAPTDTSNEANHVLWQKDRKVKTGLQETLRNSQNNHSIQSSGLIRVEIDGTARLSDTYAVRRFAKTYDVSLVSQNTIHGGTNFGRKKNLQLFHDSVAPAGRLESVPQNVVTVGVGPGQGIVQEKPNNDLSPRKKKYQLNAKIGNQYGNEYGHDVLGDFVLPLNIMSGTVNSGFNSIVEASYSSGVHIANLHNDMVGNYNETSMQSPFTEQHVGGLQYRHIDLNHGTDNEDNRPEGWGLSIAEHPVDPSADGALGFVGADYDTAGYPSSTAQKATRYRDEHAKRPVNVKNIKTVSGSWKAGNYTNEIQIFSVAPEHQKTWAVEATNDPNVDIIPSFIFNMLPDTTHYQTLMGISGEVSGNVFGIHANNRQPDGHLLTPSSPMTYANGSFYLTGSPSPATTADDASFTVYGILAANEGSVLSITQSNGSIFAYEIDLDNSLINPTYTSITGSSNNQFWNLLSSSLASDLPDYTISYTPGPDDVHSIALSQSAQSNTRLYSDSISNGNGGSNGFSVGFYIYFDTFGDDQKKMIYEAKNSTNLVSKQIYIESGSLQIEAGYFDNVSDPFYDSWYLPNFTSSYSGQLTHILFTHTGSAPTYGTFAGLSLYINGVLTSITGNKLKQGSGTFQNPFTGEIPTEKLSLFNNSLLGQPLFRAGSTGPIYLDEVVAYRGLMSQGNVDDLYNGGKFQSSKPGSPAPFAIYDFEELTVGTAVSNGTEILDSTANSNNLTASVFSLGDLVPLTSSGPSLTILKTPASASFLISGAPAGGDYNLTLGLEAPTGTFIDLDGATGGTDAGATGGIQDQDYIEFASGERFVLTESATADVGTTYYIETTGTSNQIWTSMKNRIEAETPLSVTFTDQTHQAFFEITTSVGGASGNNAMTTNSSSPYLSFYTLSGLAGGADAVSATYSIDNVIQIPRTDLTGSERNISTRFSAPGGPEIQTIGYLDAYTSTYSVHNALPWRNLSVLGSGSGEQGTIRVEDHFGLRRGLKTLRTLHQGKFGIDSQYGAITETSYPSSGSFNKQHRNTSTKYVWSGSADITASLSEPELITGSSYDNMHINSTIPRSEFQYSWIHAATSGPHWYSVDDAPRQEILGYAPRDGIISSSVGWVEAIVFPSASSITG